MSDLQEKAKKLREEHNRFNTKSGFYCNSCAHPHPCATFDFCEDVLQAIGDAKPREVTDEDALQILRGYWRDVGASFHDAEIKHVVELLEAFVARRKPDLSPELRERGVTLTAEDLADLDDMELHFSNQDTHPRWSRYRRLVTRLFNDDDALKGTT